MKSPLVRRGTAVLAVCALLALPTSALAGPETLKRGFGNMVLAPFDAAIAPVTAALVVYHNLRNIDDTTAVRVFYVVPGFVFLTSLFLMSSVLREISGVLEFIPGLGLVFTNSEMDPIFDPVERGAALLDYPTAVMDVKIGVDYTAAPF